LLDPTKADFLTTEFVDIDLENLRVPVQLSLNARGRTAITVLDEIYGCALDEALLPGVSALVPAIATAAQSSVEAVDDPAGPLTVGPPECDQLRLTIDTVDFSRDNDVLTVTFEGTFEGALSGSVVLSARDGDGLDVLQGDSEAVGRFTVWTDWNMSNASGTPSGASAEVTDWALPYVEVWPPFDAR
jgi:hypothetical protein